MPSVLHSRDVVRVVTLPAHGRGTANAVYYHSAALSFEVCAGICQLLQDHSSLVFLAVCVCFCYKKNSRKAVACLQNEKCFIMVSAAYRRLWGLNACKSVYEATLP